MATGDGDNSPSPLLRLAALKLRVHTFCVIFLPDETPSEAPTTMDTV